MPDLIEGTGPNPDYGTHHSLSSEPLGERRQRLRAEQLEAELERLRAGIREMTDEMERMRLHESATFWRRRLLEKKEDL